MIQGGSTSRVATDEDLEEQFAWSEEFAGDR
jgi:hypothetical protein